MINDGIYSVIFDLSGKSVMLVIVWFLVRSGLVFEEIDYVYVYGMVIKLNDCYEVNLI